MFVPTDFDVFSRGLRVVGLASRQLKAAETPETFEGAELWVVPVWLPPSVGSRWVKRPLSEKTGSCLA